MNSVPIALYSEKYSNGKNVSINYFGSLHTNRWKMIIKLAEIINDLNFDFVTLNVYSESVKDPDILNKFKLHGVNYMGSVYGDKLRSTICDSDILLHVENDDEYSKTLTKLSISTKIPEYLISGRPILAFGPQDIASMRFLEENNLAVVYYSSDNNNTKLKKLIEDSDFRKVLAKNAYDYAVKNFDNKKITSTFYSQIENVIGSN
jgi:glycosyltransferase involved in cell wall biosynthesis